MSPQLSSQLTIITSNRLETLADALAEVILSKPHGREIDPLLPETIVVQSKGMQDWISMALAQRNGVCANTEFPFPNAFVERLFGQVVGPLPEQRYFDPVIMAFHIMDLLPELVSLKSYGALRNYLSGELSTRKAYQLASKIADLFDQYLVFRPDYILAWDKGQKHRLPEEQAWQASLWKRICDRTSSQHRGAIQKSLISKLEDDSVDPSDLPPRISVFGISHLPPFHLQVLAALAHCIPVYLFLLNPCKHYWSDILSEQQISRVRAKHPAAPGDQQTLHLDSGNRLLASWGEQGKQFIEMVHQLDGQFHEAFHDGPGDTLLQHIQQDILNLTDHPAGEPNASFSIDRSLQIHICHSPMREVEVLYDQLLEMLNTDPDLAPRDILVMTPDIATYAPLIHAVFAAPYDDSTTIPYSVADQSVPIESRLIEGFMQLLDMYQSRFEVTQVLHLLEFPAIRQQFGIADSDIGLIEQWVRAVNIRWGWDGDSRRQQGLPRFESNTWRQGIDRLLLGYAMLGDGRSLFDNKLPYTGLDISDCQILGNFVRFVDSVNVAWHKLAQPATMAVWHQILNSMIDDFIRADEQAGRDLQMLRNAVEQIRQISILAPSDSKFEFEIIRDVMAQIMGRASFGGGFLAGSVTFCAMLPMRSIPAKVICLLGMGHDHFPQDQREPTFNLIDAHPRAGDRSKRNDDKYLFLEALISARDILYASYVGRDIQDNSPIPPSVVINELIEYAIEGFGTQYEDLVTEHPLQGFSKTYFDRSHPSLFSYSQENLAASQSDNMPALEKPFFTQPLAPPNEKRRQCDLIELAAFFANPCRYLLEQRLGINLYDSMETLDDRERFNLTALDRFHASQAMLQASMDQIDAHDIYQIFKASGTLPHGTTGQICHQQLRREVDAFVQVLSAHTPAQEPVIRSVQLEIQSYAMTAELGEIYPEVRIVKRLAKMRPHDLLGAFIGHLVQLAAGEIESDLPQKSLLICKDAVWEFGYLPDSAVILDDYLNFYWKGLHHPIRFFANSSYVYANNRLARKMTVQKSLHASTIKWLGGRFAPNAESEDPYICLCFRGMEALGDDFQNNAVRIFEPLLAAGRKISGRGI